MALRQVLRRASVRSSAVRYFVGIPCKRPLLEFAGAMAAAAASSSSLSNIAHSSGNRSSLRAFTRSMASTSGDASLLKALQSEIEHETKQEEVQEESEIPKPFKLQDKPGTRELILRRSYGSEDISITCILQRDPYENEEEGEGQHFGPESVHMDISISKGGDKPVLEIGCSTSGDDITIDKVRIMEDESEKELVYDGPEFVELDEDLQKQFSKFLEARGINEDLCEFLMQFMPKKERQEYVHWLKNIEAFIKR